MKKLIALILCLIFVMTLFVPGTLAFGPEDNPAAEAEVVEPVEAVEPAEPEAEPDGTEEPAELPAGSEEPEGEPAEPEVPAEPEAESASELTDGDVTVKGVLPAGAELVAEQVADPFAAPARRGAKSAPAKGASDASSENGDEWKAAAFYDIKLLSGGEALLPEGAVSVTIENVPLANEGGVVSVRHFLDSEAAIAAAIAEGSAEAVRDEAYVRAFPAEAAAAEAVTGESGVVFVETITEEDGLIVEGTSVTFPAKSFSIYAVGEEPARVKVIFNKGKAGGGYEQVEMILKAADTTDPAIFEQVIYDPTEGVVPEGMVFRGWVKDKQAYEPADADTPLFIDDIRAQLATIAAENTSALLVVNYYPMFFYYHTVTFLDEFGSVIIEDDVLSRTTSGDMAYTINESYTPADPDDSFEGWVQVGTGSISAPENVDYEGTANEVAYYLHGDEVTVSGDVVLEPYLPEGHWLVFRENGKGASYTGPQYIKKGNHPVKPDDPTRLGYTFGGWYRTADCFDGEEFFDGEWNNELSDRLELFAKWVAVEQANYTIIIWKQNIHGTGYDFEETVSLSGEVGSVVDTVTSEGTGNGYHAVVDGAAKEYDGFHLDYFNANVQIEPQGTSTVNVYYDRNLITLNFYTYVAGSTNYIYTETTSNSGTQYGLIDGTYQQLTYSGGAWYYDTGIPGYRPTTSNSDNPQQYGLVDGEYVPLTRHGINLIIFNTFRWTYVSGYSYTASNSNSNSPQKYGYDSVTHQYYPLTKEGNTWYMNGVRYTGQRYIQNEIETDYEGTRYVYSENGLAPFIGVRYTRTSSSWELYKSFQGLYGSSLADNEMEWPTEYDWYATGNNNGSTSGGQTTFMDSFIIPNGSSSENFYGSSPQTGNSIVEFYLQKADLSGYEDEPANSVSSNADNPTFRISDKYSGFKADHYTIDNGTPVQLGEKDSNGYYATGIAYHNSTLRIYYNRLTYSLNFMDGVYFDGNGSAIADQTDLGQLKELKNITYGSDLSSYNKGEADYYEPECAGFVFDGWCIDDQCLQPYTFTSMPDGGITVYAKWRQIQYRVFLHPNVEKGEIVSWGDQSMSFRIDHNSMIRNGSMIIGIRPDYELVGWFYDPAFTQPFSFETHLVDSTVPDTYDKSRTSEVDDIYGLPLGEKRTDTDGDGKDYVWDIDADDWLLEDGKKVPWNKDESRFWIIRSLDLYAKWRSKIDGAKGIDVEYYNGNTLVSADPDQYLDQAQAIAIAAPAAANADEEFKYWVVLHWNGTEYVEQADAQHVLPNTGFTVLKTDAREENLTAADPEYVEDVVTKKYTVRLKAVFGPIESETKTKLIYNGNEGELVSGYTVPDGYPTPAVSGNVITFEGLTINADYEALGAVFARPGYKFLGWATAANATSAQFTAGQMIAPDILDGEVNTLYAVWEEKTVSFNYVAVGPESVTDFGSVTPETDANNAIKVFSGTAAGSTASANEGFRFVGWFSDATCETLISDNAAFVPQKTDGHYPYGDADTMTVTYYAKFEYDTTTLTVTNSTGHDAIFTVTGKGYGVDSGSPIVVAIPKGQSVTIANVYVGATYTVSEDGNWSWRYTPYSGLTNALVAGGNAFSATFIAFRNQLWLSGEDAKRLSSPALYTVPTGSGN